MTTKWDHLNESDRAALNAAPLNIPCSGCGVNLSDRCGRLALVVSRLIAARYP